MSYQKKRSTDVGDLLEGGGERERDSRRGGMREGASQVPSVGRPREEKTRTIFIIEKSTVERRNPHL